MTTADAAALVYARGGAPGSDNPKVESGWQYSPPNESETGRTIRVFPPRTDGALPTTAFGAGTVGGDGVGGVVALEYFVPTPSIALYEEKGYPRIETAVQRAPGFTVNVALQTCPKVVQAAEIFWGGPAGAERLNMPDIRTLARNETVVLQATHRYDAPGVYHPLVRVEGPYAQVLSALPQISITNGYVQSACSIITATRKQRAVV
jgi:hypothetical protein